MCQCYYYWGSIGLGFGIPPVLTFPRLGNGSKPPPWLIWSLSIFLRLAADFHKRTTGRSFSNMYMYGWWLLFHLLLKLLLLVFVVVVFTSLATIHLFIRAELCLSSRFIKFLLHLRARSTTPKRAELYFNPAIGTSTALDLICERLPTTYLSRNLPIHDLSGIIRSGIDLRANPEWDWKRSKTRVIRFGAWVCRVLLIGVMILLSPSRFSTY